MSNSLRKVVWRMTAKTYVLYLSFGEVASASEPGSDQHKEAIEGLKSLPGYPLDADGDDDILWIPEVIDQPTVSVLH